MPPQFKSLEWARIKGKGWAVTVRCDQERDRANPGLKGAVVIDDETLECIGIEHRTPSGPITPGEEIALIVRDPNQHMTEADSEDLARSAWNNAIEAAARRVPHANAELSNKLRALKR